MVRYEKGHLVILRAGLLVCWTERACRLRGMALKDLIDGITDGMKGVVGGSVILLLAITIGGVSKEAGGGAYLVVC